MAIERFQEAFEYFNRYTLYHERPPLLSIRAPVDEKLETAARGSLHRSVQMRPIELQPNVGAVIVEDHLGVAFTDDDAFLREFAIRFMKANMSDMGYLPCIRL